MFLILEYNGLLPHGYIGEILNKDGTVKFFTTRTSAEKYAKKNCAFEYKVVEL